MATTKKKSWLDTVAPLPTIQPKTTSPSTTDEPKSQYKPQRLNEAGQVEDVDFKKQTKMSRAEFNKSYTPQGGMSREQELKAQFEQEQADKAYLATLNPNALTPEQISSVGQISTLPTDNIDANILQNVESRDKLGVQALDFLTGGVLLGEGALRQMTGTGVKALNRIVPGSGDAFLNSISKNENISGYLKEYSNDFNFETIKKNVNNADLKITTGKELAKYPDRREEAIALYNEGLSEKSKSLAQMNRLSRIDNEAYTTKLKDEMTTLQIYFDKIKSSDDEEMLQNLQLSTRMTNGGN